MADRLGGSGCSHEGRKPQQPSQRSPCLVVPWEQAALPTLFLLKVLHQQERRVQQEQI